MKSRGRNAGVTGLVDIQGSPKFRLKVARFAQKTGAAALTRTKRGDVWRRVRQVTPGGTLTLWGKVQQEAPPLPDHIKGAAGTIELAYSTSAKVTVTVVVVEATLSYGEKEEDTWDVALVCEVTAVPTQTGFDAAPQVVDPTPVFGKAETHEGISKVYDPDGLADTDTLRFDLEGVTDSDAGEVEAIENVIGDYVATRAGMKLRQAAFARTDAWGGVVTVTAARTTTAEDVVNQASQTTLDPQNLASTAATAAINAVPPAPTGAAFVKRGERTQELVDGHVLHVSDYGLLSTAQDQEYPRTRLVTDAAAIDQESLTADVFDVASPPDDPAPPAGGMVKVDHTDVPLTPARSVRVYRWAFVNAQTRLLNGHVRVGTDPAGLESTEVKADVWDTAAAEPAAPAVPAGLVLDAKDYLPIPGHPTKRVRVSRYAKTTSAQRVTLPKTEATLDPQNLASRGTAAAIGSTPAVPDGYKSRGLTSSVLTNGGDTLHVLEYGLRDRRDDVTMEGGEQLVDRSGLADARTVVTVTNSASFPLPTNSGSLVLRDTRVKQLHDQAWALYGAYGIQTRDREIEHRETESVAHAMAPRRDTTAQILTVTGTNTAGALIDQWYQTLKADPTFERVEVSKFHDGKALLRIVREDDAWELELASRTFGDLPTPYRLLGGGGVQLFVVDRWQFDSGTWVFVLGEVPTRCTMMDLTLWKRYTGDRLYTYLDGAGTTNSSTFLGMSAQCVTFAGIEGRVRVRDDYRYPAALDPAAVAFEAPRRVGYKFRFDSRGIVLGDGITCGYEMWTSNGLSGVPVGGWADALTLGLGATHAIYADYNQVFLGAVP